MTFKVGARILTCGSTCGSTSDEAAEVLRGAVPEG